MEIVIWRVPQPARSSTHPYKYRLAYIANQRCVLRFDNEAGKGDHKHVGERQVPSGSPMWIRCSRIFGRM